MHEAGAWGRSLYPSLRSSLVAAGRGRLHRKGSSSKRCGSPGSSTTSAMGRSPISSTTTSCRGSQRRRTPRRTADKRLSHEDLSQLIVERELGPLIGGLRRAPGGVPDRDAFADGEAIDPRWVSFLVSKPALADEAMPRWVRWLQPLLSGVFTVDNLDYVRRDAYMTGVAVNIDVERLRRYTFIGDARADALRARSRRARDVPDRPPVHVPAGLLPSDGAGDRPPPRRRSSDLRSGRSSAMDRRSSDCPPTPISTSTPSSTRLPAGRAENPLRTRRPMGTGT